MSAYDRFQPESREDFLFRGRTVIERREIADRLAREEQAKADEAKADAEHEAERAIAEDPPQPEHFRPAPGIGRDLWEMFSRPLTPPSDGPKNRDVPTGT